MTRRKLDDTCERMTTFTGRARVQYKTNSEDTDVEILESVRDGIDGLMLSRILPSCAMLPGGHSAPCKFTIYVKAERIDE